MCVFYFSADQQMKSLSSVFRFYQGFHGERGGSKNCYGANGAHMYVKVSQWVLGASLVHGWVSIWRTSLCANLTCNGG